MGLTTGIEWTDATWNPWLGCTKVSPACANCYMFRDLARWGRDGSIVQKTKTTFDLPLQRNRHNEFKIPSGSKVFTCSLSDWFHADADPWRDDAWAIIRRRPDVIFQIVTKRTERIAEHLPADWGDGYPNVWLIATAENQQWLTSRMTDLAKIRCAVRGLSIEPMLGPITLDEWIGRRLIDWVIVGGESGPGARPMLTGWAMNLLAECLDAGVPYFFKQWGEWLPLGLAEILGHDMADRQQMRVDWTGRDVSGAAGLHSESDEVVIRLGKAVAGRALAGQTFSQFPVSF